jgi:acyl carrier protein
MADGMLDSFDMVTLVAALDKNYGVSIQGTDILPEHFQNLQTIEALLRKTGAKLE